jgi:hypothetical protein
MKKKTQKKQRTTRPKGLRVGQIAAALESEGGFITRTARRLGVSHSNISQRIKESSTLQEQLSAIKERRLDMAESQLMRGVKAGDSQALFFFLKYQGRGRGYGVDHHAHRLDGQFHTVEGGDGPVKFEIVHKSKSREPDGKR